MGLRELCQTADFRERLSFCFGWFGTLCSAESAMLVEAADLMTGRSLFAMKDLLQICVANGMSRDEVRAACRELHELEAVAFYENVDGEVMARFTLLIDADEMLSPDAAILLAW